jgi:hypothetical protein
MKTVLTTLAVAVLTLLPAHATTITFNSGADILMASPGSPNTPKTEAIIPNIDSMVGVTFHQPLFSATQTDIPSVVPIPDTSFSDFSVQQDAASDQTLTGCGLVTDEKDFLTLVLTIAFVGMRSLSPQVC